ATGQGTTDRPTRRTETEDPPLQAPHSQSDASDSTVFLRGAHEYRPVAPGTRRPQPTAAVSPRWLGLSNFHDPPDASAQPFFSPSRGVQFPVCSFSSG